MAGIKIYLSSFYEKVLLKYKELRPEAEMNVLLSYGTRTPDYHNIISKHKHLISSLILDSGAFTKNNANNRIADKISLEGFITFCSIKKIRDSFDFIFNYDEDFNMDGFGTNYHNMRELNNAGINVVPVAHDYLGVSFDEIGFYINKKYPIIALGYSEHKRKNAQANISQAVNRIYQAGLKVHILGYTSPNVLGNIPVHFCDSSSWTQEGLFGNIIWWNPYKQDNSDRIKMLDYENSEVRFNYHIGNYPWRKHFESYLKDELGMTICDVYGHDKDFNRQIANIHYFITIQNKIREMHVKNSFIINQ